MSIAQLESAVKLLPQVDLLAFAEWFEEYLEDEWDREIERDAKVGLLNPAAKQAREDFRAGRCTPL